MYSFDSYNELMLKAICLDGYGHIYTKLGTWVASEKGEHKFSYELVGPGNGSILSRFGKQLLRKFTGENLKLVKTKATKGCTLYYADQGQHVSIVDLSGGQTLKVESENILAFTDTCKYGVTFFGGGVISQKGLAVSTLTGIGQGAFAAVVCDGNPLELQTPCRVDPDALVCFIGENPHLNLDVGWKNLIGKANGESYMFNFEQPGGVAMIQPFERKSGLNLAIDDGKPVYNQ